MRMFDWKKLLSRFRPGTEQPEEEIPAFGFSAAVVSDVGRERENNEDNYVLSRHSNFASADRSVFSLTDAQGKWQVAGVFDGMGGGEAGELASRAAAESLLQAFEALPEAADRPDVDRALRKSFLEANNRILQLQETYQVFGTTGTVLCADGQAFKIYHLGDSRAYFLREGVLTQLTRDQTLAQMKIEVGMYDENDPQAEIEKHKLTEFIGRDWTKENLKPTETIWNPIQAGDLVLLCSDGLYDMCTNREILEVLLTEQNLEEKARALVELANERGGVDNITCLLIQFS